jgi:hypothetical protein
LAIYRKRREASAAHVIQLNRCARSVALDGYLLYRNRDGCRSLGTVNIRIPAANVLTIEIEGITTTNRYGCVTLHSYHFYVEQGLPKTQVLLWVYGEQLRAMLDNVVLAEYQGRDNHWHEKLR